jgi:hypothetical protein
MRDDYKDMHQPCKAGFGWIKAFSQHFDHDIQVSDNALGALSLIRIMHYHQVTPRAHGA